MKLPVEKPADIQLLVTLGPASMDRRKVEAMDREGVDVFRINMSHTPAEKLPEIIRNVSQWTKKPLCVDTEGAQIRTGRMGEGTTTLRRGASVRFVGAQETGTDSVIPLYPIDPAQLLHAGDVLHLDFNSAVIQVTAVDAQGAHGRVLAGGLVGSNKGVSLDRLVELPPFTEKDRAALAIAKQHGLKHVAFSFASRGADVKWLREFFGCPVTIISKVESTAALANLAEILGVSDAILIDRGDLSRDVDIWKIGLAQKYITQCATAAGTPTYVATNLLESMFNNLQPTRAEINDVTNTLLNGASGLVLAAETAIGKYPVESVRMIRQTIREVGSYAGQVQAGSDQTTLQFIRSSSDGGLIAPHGGTLVEQPTPPGQTVANAATWPKLAIDERTALDVLQIVEGVYSPIKHFMGAAELARVVDDNRCASGEIWTMPILLQSVDKPAVKAGQWVALQAPGEARACGYLKVAAVEEIDLVSVGERWFGTHDQKHPGFTAFRDKGKFIISGEVFRAFERSAAPSPHFLTPRQSRKLFSTMGWRTIVAFHTRNIVHAGHLFIQREALKRANADALFISPVIGPKKAGDFTAPAILGAYDVALKEDLYAPYPAVLGVFNTYPRYAGPHEAAFTAICRKNFGCSHIVVGRDHTGVGNYYSANASQEIFGKLGDIGIQPILFEAAYYCADCGQVTESCAHPASRRESLSATQVREAILSAAGVPAHMVAPPIKEFLREFVAAGHPLFE
ncbi:MAG: pyruvate kinase [Bacteriovoracia bacterium]